MDNYISDNLAEFYSFDNLVTAFEVSLEHSRKRLAATAQREWISDKFLARTCAEFRETLNSLRIVKRARVEAHRTIIKERGIVNCWLTVGRLMDLKLVNAEYTKVTR
jgi:hypothetical protein